MSNKVLALVLLLSAGLISVLAHYFRDSVIRSPSHVAKEEASRTSEPSSLTLSTVEKGWLQPMFRANPQRTGRLPFSGPDAPLLRWKFKTEDRITSQPAAWQDRIYVGSHDGYLYALDRGGELIWKTNLRDRIYSSPLIDFEGNIYVGSDADRFWSLDPSGQIRWVVDTEGDADTGAVINGSNEVIFAAGIGVYAVETTGIVRWKFDAKGKVYASPVLDAEGNIYFGSQDDSLYSLDPSGTLRWNFAVQDDIDSTAVIDEHGRIFFASDAGEVVALDSQGQVLWRADLGAHVRAPLALGDDHSILVGTFGTNPALYSLRRRNGATLWKYALTPTDSPDLGLMSGAVVDKVGNIYLGGHDDTVRCINPYGQQLWTYQLSADVDGPVTINSSGELYFGSDDGNLYALQGNSP